jgi:hypothetical protein
MAAPEYEARAMTKYRFFFFGGGRFSLLYKAVDLGLPSSVEEGVGSGTLSTGAESVGSLPPLSSFSFFSLYSNKQLSVRSTIWKT